MKYKNRIYSSFQTVCDSRKEATADRKRPDRKILKDLFLNSRFKKYSSLLYFLYFLLFFISFFYFLFIFSVFFSFLQLLFISSFSFHSFILFSFFSLFSSIFITLFYWFWQLCKWKILFIDGVYMHWIFYTFISFSIRFMMAIKFILTITRVMPAIEGLNIFVYRETER